MGKHTSQHGIMNKYLVMLGSMGNSILIFDMTVTSQYTSICMLPLSAYLFVLLAQSKCARCLPERSPASFCVDLVFAARVAVCLLYLEMPLALSLLLFSVDVHA